MKSENSVFEQNYEYYLERIRNVSLDTVAESLGGRKKGNALIIPFFGTDFEVSHEGILDPSGKRAGYDISIIISKYILMCPKGPTGKKEWVSFRDLKDSGPLLNYFAKDVENPAAALLSGKDPDAVRKASGGRAPDLDVSYDLSLRFDALPRVPLILLFNDADEEFPATCGVLFESRVEQYIDAECIAMVGARLVRMLKKRLENP